MPRHTWAPLMVGSLALLSACKPADRPTTSGVTLQVVTKQGYLATLAGLRGKIAVVDVWGEF